MITAWSLPRLVRARACAGPLLRVLTMVVLLFGIVSTHGLSTKSAEGHLVTSDVSPVAVLHNEPALSAASSTALRLSAVQQV